MVLNLKCFFTMRDLMGFFSQSDLKGRKDRWAKILQEYDCKLRYHQG